MRWYVIFEIKVLCLRSGSHRIIKQNDKLCHVQNSGSTALLKVTGIKGQYKGSFVAFVTYCNISCFQISFNLAGN